MLKRKKQYRYLSADGKSNIHAVQWLPAEKPVAVLQMTHGMVEYIERYAPFARYLNRRGFVVAGHDHIGHGASVSNTADWGVMDAEHPSEVMVEDLYTHYTMLKEEYPDVPYFILGHSMGSYVLRQFLSQKADGIGGLDGAIIMGTGVESDSMLNVGMAIIRFLAAFRSWRFRSKLVAQLCFTSPYREYDISGTYSDNSWLTKDQAIVKRYYSDPKCSFLFTLGAYKGLFETCQYSNNPEHIDRIPKDLPIILASGACDPVGNMGKSVEKVYHSYLDAGIKDVVLRLFPDDRHEILNELDRDLVYAELYDWMNQVMKKKRS